MKIVCAKLRVRDRVPILDGSSLCALPAPFFAVTRTGFPCPWTFYGPYYILPLTLAHFYSVTIDMGLL